MKTQFRRPNVTDCIMIIVALLTASLFICHTLNIQLFGAFYGNLCGMVGGLVAAWMDWNEQHKRSTRLPSYLLIVVLTITATLYSKITNTYNTPTQQQISCP